MQDTVPLLNGTSAGPPSSTAEAILEAFGEFHRVSEPITKDQFCDILRLADPTLNDEARQEYLDILFGSVTFPMESIESFVRESIDSSYREDRNLGDEGK